MQRLRSRLSYSNVVASVALFVALSAPGAAAAKAMITGADIRDGKHRHACAQRFSRRLRPRLVTV